jgi:acetoin utilization deacetylase AcuC-like enzyme
MGNHVFPTIKYRMIYRELIESGVVREEDFLEPPFLKEEDILLVHTPEYVEKLKKGKLSYTEILSLELPYSEELLEASWTCAGGTFLSCECALQDGISIHIGGGFHHAFPDHGEGFCIFNDVAIAVRKMRSEFDITKVLILDCDVHQGNGTASIFSQDPSTFTFSIHQQNNYPLFKPESDLDIGLSDHTEDGEYLSILKENLLRVIEDFEPEFILYIAGADPYVEDQLGGLSLTLDGLRERDVLVFLEAKKRGIPISTVLGGGYAKRVDDTVKIHTNTIKAAISIWEE